MSTALVPVGEASFAQTLFEHYRAVRQRLRGPEIVPKLPPLRRDLILSEPHLPPGVIEAISRQEARSRLRQSAPEPHTVADIIPRRFGHHPERMKPLSAAAHRVAARRAIAAYLAAVREDPQGRPLQTLKRAVVSSFKVDMVVMTSPNRRRPCQQPRQLAMCMARMLTTASLSEVGNAFGGRDHTTVYHAFRKYRPLVLELLTEMYDGQSCEIGARP